MEHLEVDLPATEASEEEVERNNVEEDVAGDKVERGVKSVKPIGAEIWAGKVLELVLEVASRQIRLAPAWVWHELCKIFDNRGHTDLNHGPIGLQPIALPLSYIPRHVTRRRKCKIIVL